MERTAFHSPAIYHIRSDIFIITAFIIMLLPRRNSPCRRNPFSNAGTCRPLTAGAVPPLLLWIVGICLLVISILAGIWIYRLLTRKTTALDMIKLEAEKPGGPC